MHHAQNLHVRYAHESHMNLCKAFSCAVDFFAVVACCLVLVHHTHMLQTLKCRQLCIRKRCFCGSNTVSKSPSNNAVMVWWPVHARTSGQQNVNNIFQAKTTVSGQLETASGMLHHMKRQQSSRCPPWGYNHDPVTPAGKRYGQAANNITQTTCLAPWSNFRGHKDGV